MLMFLVRIVQRTADNSIYFRHSGSNINTRELSIMSSGFFNVLTLVKFHHEKKTIYYEFNKINENKLINW